MTVTVTMVMDVIVTVKKRQASTVTLLLEGEQLELLFEMMD